MTKLISEQKSKKQARIFRSPDWSLKALIGLGFAPDLAKTINGDKILSARILGAR